jgi:thymidylate synthase
MNLNEVETLDEGETGAEPEPQAEFVPPAACGRRGARLATRTLGEAWIEVARLILAEGAESSFGGLPLKEVDLVTLDIARPDPDDALIEAHASPEWLRWMRGTFTDRSRVAELGDARSYASRLHDYAGSGRDQIAAVVETLRRDPRASYATITTFEPLTDVSYIPCVSLLDFWLRSGRLELVVYAHSIDFGKKGFGNLAQLAELQRDVAERLHAPIGPLVMIVKSATIYHTEVELMSEVIAAAGLAQKLRVIPAKAGIQWGHDETAE